MLRQYSTCSLHSCQVVIGANHKVPSGMSIAIEPQPVEEDSDDESLEVASVSALGVMEEDEEEYEEEGEEEKEKEGGGDVAEGSEEEGAEALGMEEKKSGRSGKAYDEDAVSGDGEASCATVASFPRMVEKFTPTNNMIQPHQGAIHAFQAGSMRQWVEPLLTNLFSHKPPSGWLVFH